jgi:energy-coupling factor transporter transmembrane protein EcfT
MIRFGQYYSADSFGHRLDARVKILATVVLSVLILQARGWEMLLLSFSLFAFCAASRLKASAFRDALRPLVLFAGLLFVLHLFFTDGTVVFQMPCLPVAITREGFLRGLFISWQFLCLALGGAVLTLTTTPSDLVCGLEHLLAPLKRLRIPVQDIAVMVSMALRFVPVFLEEYDRIKTAQAARGACVETGRYDQKLKALAALLMPLITGAFRRADDLAEAMEARGYAHGPRTTLHQLHFGAEETLALFVLFLLLAVLLGSRYCG